MDKTSKNQTYHNGENMCIETNTIQNPNAGHMQKTHQGVNENGKTHANVVATHHSYNNIAEKRKCKHCGSFKTYKKGKRKLSGTQRYYCRDCERTFQYRGTIVPYPCIHCGELITDATSFLRTVCTLCRKKERKEHWLKYKKEYLGKLIKLGSTSCNLYEHATRKSNGELDFEKERKKIDKELIRVWRYNGSNPSWKTEFMLGHKL